MTKSVKSDGRRIRYPWPPQAHLNRKKYACAPTWEQIDSFIKESGMKMYHFEKFYGMPLNHLATVKNGRCKLAGAYWHFIYEKIKPTYGVGFIQDYTPGFYNQNNNTVTTVKSKKVSREKEPPVIEENDIHGRVNKIK